MWRPFPQTTRIFATFPNLSVNEMIEFCLFVPFFLLLLLLFYFLRFHEIDRDQPSTVHAIMNCVKTKLIPLFWFPVLDYFWISLYIDI